MSPVQTHDPLTDPLYIINGCCHGYQLAGLQVLRGQQLFNGHVTCIKGHLTCVRCHGNSHTMGGGAFRTILLSLYSYVELYFVIYLSSINFCLDMSEHPDGILTLCKKLVNFFLQNAIKMKPMSKSPQKPEFSNSLNQRIMSKNLNLNT